MAVDGIDIWESYPNDPNINVKDCTSDRNADEDGCNASAYSQEPYSNQKDKNFSNLIGTYTDTPLLQAKDDFRKSEIKAAAIDLGSKRVQEESKKSVAFQTQETRDQPIALSSSTY